MNDWNNIGFSEAPLGSSGVTVHCTDGDVIIPTA